MRSKKNSFKMSVVSFLALVVFGVQFTLGQVPTETPPPPSAPPSVTLPEVKEMTLPNGLKVVVVQKRGLPLVTTSLLIKSGSYDEDAGEAGLAGMTASLLTKGTELHSATEISEQIEFLGGSIGSRAGWNSSTMTINVMKSSLGKALSIMSDAVTRSSFPENEIKLLKKQALDGLKVGLKQPGALLRFVSSRYSLNEHNATPQTIARINRDKIVAFHKEQYRPDNAVLIFTGDITEKKRIWICKIVFWRLERSAFYNTERNKRGRKRNRNT